MATFVSVNNIVFHLHFDCLIGLFNNICFVFFVMNLDLKKKR